MIHCVGEPAPAHRAQYFVSWVFAGFAMIVLATTPALGQFVVTPPSGPSSLVDPTGRSGQPPGPLKEEFQRPQPPPSPVLPIVPLPPEGEAPKKPGGVQVFVRDIMVTGNTVFSEEGINQVTAPYKNRTLATEDLERLRLALTLKYINKGYLTSGAIIPDQDVQAGVVAVHMIEGQLADIHV
jgi:hemolysin activation/secretion protein